MASDVNITGGVIDIVAQLNEDKSYEIISKQLEDVAKKINSNNDFKLNVGVSVANIDKNIKEAVNRRINVVQGEIKPLDIKVQSEGAKAVSAEIDKLINSLKKQGMTDFKLSYSGDDEGNIRRATVEYKDLADGISKVIQQQYVLRDITEKGNLVGQVWEEGSKVVAKYTEGQDAVKASAIATKAALSDLSKIIKEVNSDLAKSEEAELLGNQQTSDALFSRAAANEIKAKQILQDLDKKGLIAEQDRVEWQNKLEEAISSSSKKADLLNSKLKDKEVKEALEERVRIEKQAQEQRERLNTAYREAEYGQLFEKEELYKEITSLSQEMFGWLTSNKGLGDSAYFSAEINNLIEGLKSGKITAEDAKIALEKLKVEAKDVGITGETMGRKIVASLKDIANIATVAEVVRTLYNAVKQVVANVRELDDAMVDLQIASGASADEVERMMSDYHALAKELGATSIEVAQAADGWLRQGYSAMESAELIRNSTMLAKLGQMETAEATDALTSAMKGYKLGVEEAEHIVDKFAATDMSAAVSAGYLATAMSKTAVGAKEMGIDFDSLTGYIATVGEVTQDSAESVGTFFKTLIARMGNIKAGNLVDPETAESLSDVEAVLGGLGIKLRASSGEFESFKTVLDTVAKRWESYNSVQRQSIAVAFSGTRQQEKFKVLMDNYSDSMRLAEVATNSAGTATEKYEAYLDSITASIEELKSSVYDFSDSFLNSDLVKGVVEIGTFIVKTATTVVDKLGTIPTLLGVGGVLSGGKLLINLFDVAKAAETAGGKIEVLEEVFKTFDEGTLNKALKNTKEGMPPLLSMLDLLPEKLKKSGEKFKEYGKYIGGLITGHWQLIAGVTALIAVITAIVALQKRAQKQYEKTTEAIQKHNDTISSLNEEKSSIESLIEKYEQLKSARDSSFTKVDQKALDDAKADLAILEKKIAYEEYLLELQKKQQAMVADKVIKGNKVDSGDVVNAYLMRQQDNDDFVSTEDVLNQILANIASNNDEVNGLREDIVKLGDLTDANSDEYARLIAELEFAEGEQIDYALAVNEYLAEVKKYANDMSDSELKNTVLSLIDAIENEIVTKGVDPYTSLFDGFVVQVEENSDALRAFKEILGEVFKESADPSALYAAKKALEEFLGISLNLDKGNLINVLQIINSYINGNMADFEKLAYTAIKSLGITPKTRGIEGAIDSLIGSVGSLEGSTGEAAKVLLDLFVALGKIKVTSFEDVLNSPVEDNGTRIGNFFYSYVEGVEEVAEALGDFKTTVDASAEGLDKLKSAIDTALDWRSTTEQTRAALAEIKKLSGIELDMDAEGVNDTLMLMKSYIDGDAEAFEEFAETAAKSLGIKPSTAGIEGVLKGLIIQLGTLKGKVDDATSGFLNFFKSIGAVEIKGLGEGLKAWGDDFDYRVGNYLYKINDDWLDNFNTKKEYSGSSSGGSKTDTYLENYKKLVAELDHLRAMDYISEEEYYRRLQALADKYLKGKSKYVDEYRNVQEQLWAYQKELYEQQRDADIKAAEDRAEARKKALEDEYDAEREALEKRKDLFEEEKDAYKDLIDYKKDLLDEASDSRSHNQRVDELNSQIANIQAELDAIALDNSAKANARRIELREELLNAQKELENEQYDWSVDTQKDALDEEYDRYEKTIDAQIKLLDEQLDALQKNYDAQLEHIDSMLEANIAAINSSFDALINRAADAAAQIQAIFANINISTSSGVTGLQQGLVDSGYNIGNYGANKDGVDGILGEKTTKGLQQYLNDLQSSGAIYFGNDLKIDGKVGSRTREAIDAAIAAGYLDKSFDKLHTGGIVGKKSGRTDEEVLSKLIPIEADEVWAKLLKNELVLTEKQQDAVRNAFSSLVNMRNVSDANKLQRSNNGGLGNSIAVSIQNVFEGNVDSEALRRLENWGESFKKDVQNGVFATMNKQNRFSGRTPIKST